MATIDEVIADAIAEEEVKKNMAAPAFQILPPMDDTKVTISLEEYKRLVLTENYYNRLLDEVESFIALSYDKKRLYIDANLTDFYRILYPEKYKAAYEKLIAEEPNEDE
jgi:hypothetical protein